MTEIKQERVADCWKFFPEGQSIHRCDEEGLAICGVDRGHKQRGMTIKSLHDQVKLLATRYPPSGAVFCRNCERIHESDQEN